VLSLTGSPLAFGAFRHSIRWLTVASLTFTTANRLLTRPLGDSHFRGRDGPTPYLDDLHTAVSGLLKEMRQIGSGGRP